MNCQKAELIAGYADGELDLARSLDVEQHMQECGICASAYSSQTALRSTLKNSSLYYPAPEKLRKNIGSALRQEAKSEAQPQAFFGRWLPVATALAFMLLVAFLIWRPAPGYRPSRDELLAQEVVSHHVLSLMGSHLADVLSTDQHTVKPWFDGKIDFAPPVSNFSNQGFPLIGGRLEYLNNRTVAALIYQRQKHYINLFIWPAEQNDSTSETPVKRQGYNLIHWTGGGMNYWAVSDLNSVELHEFALLVQGAQ